MLQSLHGCLLFAVEARLCVWCLFAGCGLVWRDPCVAQSQRAVFSTGSVGVASYEPSHWQSTTQPVPSIFKECFVDMLAGCMRIGCVDSEKPPLTFSACTGVAQNTLVTGGCVVMGVSALCRGHCGRKLAHLAYMDVVMEYAKTKNWEGIVWAFEAGYGFAVDRDGNTLLHHAANAGRCVTYAVS